MKITLMRHGKPLLPVTGWCRAAEMGRWIDQYNQAVVAMESAPKNLLTLIDPETTVITSPLPRALSSAQALGCAHPLIDPLFCEAPLPYAQWRLLPLPPGIWVVLFRLLWLCGYSRGVDSLGETKSRAKAAALRLITLAEKGPVLLVGHGIMNRLIAKALVAAGWVAPLEHKSSYWSANIYSLKR